jgi:hypothetical protein
MAEPLVHRTAARHFAAKSTADGINKNPPARNTTLEGFLLAVL